MPGYMPLGTLPDPNNSLGFQLLGGYPRERSTARGMEAQLVFAGPSANRYQFIDELFGVWSFNTEVVGQDTLCCAESLKPPRCYSLYRFSAAGGAYYENLWPDTFDIQPMEAPSPYYDPLTNPEPNPIEDAYRPQLEWGVHYSCPCQISVNYRSKRMANSNLSSPVLRQPWPDFMYQSGLCPGDEHVNCLSASLPAVEDYTFIDYNQRVSVDAQTIPGWLLKYNDIEPGWPAGSAAKIPDDINVPFFIRTTEIEVEWSNVPLPNWQVIDETIGHVNSTEIWGFPEESVMFDGYEFDTFRTWYNFDVYTLRMKFTAKTVSAYEENDGGGGDKFVGGTCSKQMGYWNRRWCEHLVKDGARAASPFRKVYKAGELATDPEALPYTPREMKSLFSFPWLCNGT